MSIVGFNLNAAGNVDDGTESGINRVENFGGMVPVGFRRSWCYPTNFTPSYNNGVGAAPEGVSTRWTSTLAAGIWSQASIRFIFRGTRLGLIWDGSDVINGYYRDMSVIVDGVIYKVSRQPLNGWDNVTLAQPSGWTSTLIATHLPDGLHVGEVGAGPDPTSTYLSRNTVYGVLLEERAGYHRLAGNIGSLITGPMVPATVTAIDYSSGVFSTAARGFRGVMYYNTDTAASHTVTVYSGNTPIWSQTLAEAGTADCSAVMNLLGPSNWDFDGGSTLKHVADTAGKVQATYLTGGF